MGFPNRVYMSRAARASSLVLVALLLPLGTEGVASAAGAGSATVGSVLSAARSAIGKQTSVHLTVDLASASNTLSEHVAADLGRQAGIETITEGTANAQIRVTRGFAYVSGNSTGLTKIIGLTATQVKKVGHKWVSVKAGSSQYSGLATSTTVGSVTSVLPKAKGTRLSGPGAAGKQLYTLKWTTAATSSTPSLAQMLTLSAVGPTLPVQEITTAAGGGKETLAMSRWDERLQVVAPTAGSTVPYSKIGH
jgi:hypothetical protein